MKTDKPSAYMSLDEWLDEIENYSSRRERLYDELEDNPRRAIAWIEEAWKQASRTARIQELILQTELYQKQKEDV